MKELLIVDTHVHTYPTAAIGQAAIQGTARTKDSGTIDELRAVMSRAGISYSVLANMTPTYLMKIAALNNLPAASREEKAQREIASKMIERMKRRNRWTCDVAKEKPGLVPLIGVDVEQTPEDMSGEIEDLARNHGAGGIKLHPMANEFFPYDRRLWPAYAKASEMNLPILFHSGPMEIGGASGKEYARPAYFREVLEKFPRLKVILAHMGRGYLQETLDLAGKYPNVYFDTSVIISGVAGESYFKDSGEAVAFFRKVGISRILFGTDWPWLDPVLCVEQIKGLGLREEEQRRILGENAAEIFGLKKIA